jgi:hypothetical protein
MKEDIIAMAREAGLQVLLSDAVMMAENAYKKGQADGREACAVLCDQLSDSSRDLRFGSAIRARGQA